LPSVDVVGLQPTITEPFSGALLTGRAGILLSIPGLKGRRFFTTSYHRNNQSRGNEFSFHVYYLFV